VEIYRGVVERGKDMNTLKSRIYYYLTIWRDNPKMPDFIVNFIDYLRYEWFYK
jgi:hypothetical protein